MTLRQLVIVVVAGGLAGVIWRVTNGDHLAGLVSFPFLLFWLHRWTAPARS
ncbi:hypothetical protein JIG36_12005 [Actinoplanes sp. LDG1-06]|uniref:Uncharacterized protein n=1 Tax=Paractinoplanes ovalisporus TaxID=2810368 RepID=A0ABS2AAJ4_9ACTN|nr:hypothetical protein [Actinoplanes ovalisporus]MBM2616281.1 hypothetical protein [Actinoplanes ovalisporus]